jgi:hypothetical protein
MSVHDVPRARIQDARRGTMPGGRCVKDVSDRRYQPDRPRS